MPVARKPATISNYQFLCALLYIIENGYKWRVMPKKYGNWHSVYMKFSWWSKNGTIQKIFDEMQKIDLIKTDTNVLCIDSTSIKAHPDTASARKSNRNQDIGWWEGDRQQNSIFAVPQNGMRLPFIYLPKTTTMPQKAGSWLGAFVPGTATPFWWTGHMKMIKPVLWLQNRGFFLLSRQRKTGGSHGIMTGNFINAATRWNAIF